MRTSPSDGAETAPHEGLIHRLGVHRPPAIVMRWVVAVVTVGVISAVPVRAQQHGAAVAETVTLDVIGPRSAASVRSWLARGLPSLAACRREEVQLVVVAFAIAPDGSLVSVEPRAAPSASVSATACVVEAMRRWRRTGRARSVTTVSWSARLAANPSVSCHCFSWVHGGDHGESCSNTADGCEAEAEGSRPDRTECRAATRSSCRDWAIIDGARMERP